MMKHSIIRPVDYAIFAVSLILSVAIGAYFSRRGNSTKEYFLRENNIGIIPVAISLIASFVSGISVLGIPSEVYNYGTQLSIESFSYPIGAVFIMLTMISVLHESGISSSFEYFELRFHSSLRKLASVLYLICYILYLPMVVYTPALALSQTSGLSTDILIPVVCVVCTFYTALGGLRGVIWTDVYQSFIMLIASVSLAVIGTKNVGGVSNVWHYAQESDRLEFFNMSTDATIRHTFWSVLVNTLVLNISVMTTPLNVQRFIGMPTVSKAKITVFLFGFGLFFFYALIHYSGLAVYATFRDCDPVSQKFVTNADELTPYFFVEYADIIPGLTGLFIASIFCATMSTMSSVLNTVAFTIYEDLVRKYFKNVSDSKTALVMKMIVITFGALTLILSFFVGRLGGVVQVKTILMSITNGSIIGFFCLGMFIPFSNTKGALAGGIVSSALIAWMSIGQMSANIIYPKKPISTEGCHNGTVIPLPSSFNYSTPMDEVFPLYRISFDYFAPIGFVSCVLIGIIVSLFTKAKEQKVDPRLVSPIVRRFVTVGPSGHKQS